MSDYSGIGDGICGLFMAGFILLCIFIPLGLWKLIELIIYVCHHLHWN